MPIWLTLMRIELAIPRGCRARDLGVGDEDVVADELPLAPIACVSNFQPAQSSSAMPSSIERIG